MANRVGGGPKIHMPWLVHGIPEGHTLEFRKQLEAATDEELQAAWEVETDDDWSWARLELSLVMSRRGHKDAHNARIDKAMRDHPAI
jgi:hypothetical protein